MTATSEQLHSALIYCLDFAKVMLEKAEEFYPFGATIDQQGELSASGAWMGEDHPDKQEAFSFLNNALRTKLSDGTVIAIAVAADVNIPRQFSPAFPDGVRISLESAD